MLFCFFEMIGFDVHDGHLQFCPAALVVSGGEGGGAFPRGQSFFAGKRLEVVMSFGEVSGDFKIVRIQS